MKLLRKLSVILTATMVVSSLSYITAFGQVNNSGQAGVKHGFRLVKQTCLNSTGITAMQYEHVKSGAKLMYLKNEDTNKAFTINFRTPPADNTGVNHIIEHCLLDGSRNYPVKSLITATGRQSMKTFFNAFTDSDITSYVAASRNEKDFKNLVDIYMDAVLYPNVLTNPKIFLQEAGHYELDSTESELKYNGVVYNEMKAGSSPINTLYSKIFQTLLPNSVYRWDSGGEPDVMPNLTYENLVQTYNKYYHPSNSYIYLYGDLNIDETLELLDSKYLSKFGRKETDSGIKPQESLKKSAECTFEYGIPKDSPAENKAYLTWSCVLDKEANAEVSKSFEMISALLFDNSSSFKKAMADKGFNDVQYSIVTMLQPVFTIMCENSDENRKKEFAKTIEDELKKITVNGFNKKDISALLHSYEVKPHREALDSDRGVTYSRKLMQMWLYDGDPLANLDYSMDINILKRELKENYFEKLIKKYMLNNSHKAVVVLKPRQGLAEEEAAASESRLRDYKNKLSDTEVNKLIKQTQELKKWQSEPDSEEALSRMPTLELSDLKSKNDCMIEPGIYSVDGIKVLFTPVDTNGMNYLNFYFDTSTVPQDKLPYLKLLEALMGQTGTEKYSSADISNALQRKTAGDLSFFSYHFGKTDSTDIYNPKMMVSVSTLDNDLDATVELLNQIMVKSKFEDKELLKALILEQKNAAKSTATSNYMGMLRFNSYISEKDRYYECLYGRPYYEFINSLDKDFDQKWSEIKNSITSVYKCVFNKNNLILGFVGSNDEYKAYSNKLGTLLKGMNGSKLATYKYKFPNTDINEGLITRQTVNSSIKGYNIKTLGYEYNGSMAVLETILSEYLFNEIRVKGGAYGAKASISNDGNVVFDSARDPHIIETLNVFDSTASFLRSFKADRKKMTNYIIGTIAKKDWSASLDIISKARNSQQLYIMGETQEALQKERNEILNTKEEDIRALADVIDAVIKQNCFCVAGSEADINSEKDLFNNIKYLIEK